MSEIQSKAVVSSGAKALHVVVKGKVLRVRRYEKHIYTTIVCPAVDQYSRPSVVEIRSKARFAEGDDETAVTAVLGGYEGKSYRVTNRETGEATSLTPVHMFLDAVEA